MPIASVWDLRIEMAVRADIRSNSGGLCSRILAVPESAKRRLELLRTELCTAPYNAKRVVSLVDAAHLACLVAGFRRR